MEFGICLEMVFQNIPLRDRFARAAACGFRRVEMWYPVGGSFDGSPDDLAALARDHNLTITNTLCGAPGAGALTNPADRDSWLAGARAALDFNRRAGIPAAIVCTGNTIPELSDAAMLASVVEGLRRLLPHAHEAGVTLLLEPLNTLHDHPGYWLTSSDRAAHICRILDSPNMKMLFDCYHQQIMEGDLLDHITRNLDVIGHFHSAGVPGRHELFLGEINYPYLVREIDRAGYAGTFGIEYTPTLPDDESLRRTLAHLRP